MSNEIKRSSRTNEVRTVVEDYKGIIVRVNYYWDSHGELINWNSLTHDPLFWPRADVKINKYAFTESLAGADLDFTTYQLVVDNRIITGDVLDWKVETNESGALSLLCSVAVGWG